MPVEALCEAIAELARTDPSEWSTPESLCALDRAIAQLQSVRARAASAVDVAEEWVETGAKTAAAWFSQVRHLPLPEARKLMKRGYDLRSMPKVAEAFEAGRITEAHVDQLRRCRRPKTAEAFARDEALLVASACDLPFADFCTALEYWLQLADPDGSGKNDADRHTRRSASVEVVGDMVYGKFTLDPFEGATVINALTPIEQGLFQHDWALAKARLGRDPLPSELDRTRGQRLADAFVEMAKRSVRAPEKGKAPRPLFTVLVGYESLQGRICQLDTGQTVDPVSLLPYVDEADLERAVFSPTGRVEIGEKERFFRGATRRAVEVRDRVCAHPMCSEPAARCQVDHIVPYSEGGPTTQENGQLLCAFHNRWAYNEWRRKRSGRPPPEGP